MVMEYNKRGRSKKIGEIIMELSDYVDPDGDEFAKESTWHLLRCSDPSAMLTVTVVSMAINESKFSEEKLSAVQVDSFFNFHSTLATFVGCRECTTTRPRCRQSKYRRQCRYLILSVFFEKILWELFCTVAEYCTFCSKPHGLVRRRHLQRRRRHETR